jgi:hypothetical protein
MPHEATAVLRRKKPSPSIRERPAGTTAATFLERVPPRTVLQPAARRVPPSAPVRKAIHTATSSSGAFHPPFES